MSRPSPITGTALVELLSTTAPFDVLSRTQLEHLAPLAINRYFPRNAMVFQHGDPAEGLYCIHSGRVKVQLYGEKSNEVILAMLGAGECFGEMALIDRQKRSADVYTLSECHLLFFPATLLRPYLESLPPLAIGLMNLLNNRLRASNNHLWSLATLDVCGRVARLLLDLAEREGGNEITTLPTQREIAAMLGTSREMVNRSLRDLQNMGQISIDGNRVILHLD